MQRLTSLIAAVALAAAGTAAIAQYTGPSSAAPSASASAATAAGHYTGPSSVPLKTVKQVLAEGRDDEHVRLQGRIVSHDGGKNYTFADETGRVKVEISAKHFPPGQPVSAEQRVELMAEIDKGFRSMEIEVESMRLLP